MRNLLAYAALALLSISSAVAHQPSTAYLTINDTEETLAGSWDVPLIELQLLLDLDKNDDLQITWGEIIGAQAEIQSVIDKQLVLKVDDQPCDLKFEQLLANKLNDDGYLHLPWTTDCKSARSTSLNYQLFSQLGVDHRALLRRLSDNGVHTSVIRPSENDQTLSKSGFVTFIREGVIHILIGYDHLLFLLLLLLPLISTSWRTTARKSLWLITAFTVAHSTTLALVTLTSLSLPIKLVELSIAFSIVIAAGLLVWRPQHNMSTLFALALGLLHGLGFANVLRELLANNDGLALHLLGFNLGVEIGQLAIASLVIPVLFLIHQRFKYTNAVRGLSLLALFIAIYWCIDRL